MIDPNGSSNLPQPLPPHLIKEMALDIGKEVAAYIERQYPRAVEATSRSFLVSVRNCVYNEIIAAIGSNDPDQIAERLTRRKKERRKLRTMWKNMRTIQVGEGEKVDDILNDRVPLEPDL